MVEGLLQHLRVTQADILAHDYGDSVAQELIARHYDRLGQQQVDWTIGRVYLLNGGLFPGTHHPRFIQNALASPIGKLLTPFLNRRKLARNFKAIFGPQTQPTEQEIDEFYALIDHQNGKYIFHLLIRYMREREIHEQRWRSALTRGELPVRFINGAYDPISGQHVADYYREIIPNPDVVILSSIGHYPQTEAPKDVWDAMQQ